MRLRASNHGASASAKAFTIAVMAAAMLGQLFAISHEMTVRHFRCAEHGELTHVAALAPGALEVGPRPSNDAFSAPEREVADAHEHCGVAFTLEGSSCTPSPGGAIGAVSPPPPAHPAPAALALVGREGVLASAPKTSPPSA